MARVAAGISERLRMLSQHQVSVESPAHLVGDFHLEHDSLGQREIPDHAYYGVQTQRAMENFAISGVFVSNFEHLVEGLAMQRRLRHWQISNWEFSTREKDKRSAVPVTNFWTANCGSISPSTCFRAEPEHQPT